jgi:uncharacterized membrane protein
MGIVLALVIGIVAGLRTATPLAALAWGAWLGWIPVGETWASFLGSIWAVAILTVVAVAEFVADQLPTTPSRKVPQQFGARLLSGAFSGAVIGTVGGAVVPGLIAGIVGAGLGTYSGAAARAAMAERFGEDRPAALIEDAVAVVVALAVVAAA